MSRILLAGLLAAALSAPANATEWFDLADYRALKAGDRETLDLVLTAMYESVYYAQHSIGGATVCASPVPVQGGQLVALVDYELAHPSHPTHTSYADSDHVAFVLVNALKREGACK